MSAAIHATSITHDERNAFEPFTLTLRQSGQIVYMGAFKTFVDASAYASTEAALVLQEPKLVNACEAAGCAREPKLATLECTLPPDHMPGCALVWHPPEGKAPIKMAVPANVARGQRLRFSVPIQTLALGSGERVSVQIPQNC